LAVVVIDILPSRGTFSLADVDNEYERRFIYSFRKSSPGLSTEPVIFNNAGWIPRDAVENSLRC